MERVVAQLAPKVDGFKRTLPAGYGIEVAVSRLPFENFAKARRKAGLAFNHHAYASDAVLRLRDDIASIHSMKTCLLQAAFDVGSGAWADSR